MEAEEAEEEAAGENHESHEAAVNEEAEDIGGEISVQTQDFTHDAGDTTHADDAHSGHDSKHK